MFLDFSFGVLLLLFVLDAGSFVYGLGLALTLAISVLLHELGHALTARAFGYATRDITLSLLGGCAALTALPRKAWQELLTAAAGPAVSFLLFALASLALAVLPITNPWVYTMLYYARGVNFMLGCFNLLPGFPMDGGRIFRSLARAFTTRLRATFLAMVVGRVFAVFLALVGLWRIVHGGEWGFITVLIAWMIWREGAREYQLAAAEESWGSWDFSARVSPPPYGGTSDETEVRRR